MHILRNTINHFPCVMPQALGGDVVKNSKPAQVGYKTFVSAPILSRFFSCSSFLSYSVPAHPRRSSKCSLKVAHTSTATGGTSSEATAPSHNCLSVATMGTADASPTSQSPEQTEIRWALQYSHQDIVSGMPLLLGLPTVPCGTCVDSRGVRCISCEATDNSFCNSVTETDVMVFGSSDDCPNHGMLLGNPPSILSVQGHPEFSTSSGAECLRRILDRKLKCGTIDRHVYDEAVKQVERPTDYLTIGRAMVALFSNKCLRVSA
eukprot:GHVQ01013187.1.p1 GENE.GHVQ01013187.1~~GHVQ01013187.1.p1  ORF type:complete len:263 (-),score=31.58 GHVQ01013187.1:207-995(-)